MTDDAVIIRSPLTDRIDGRDVIHKVPLAQVDGDLAIGRALLEHPENEITLVVTQLVSRTRAALWAAAHLVPDFLLPSSPVLLSMARQAATHATRRNWNEMVLEGMR